MSSKHKGEHIWATDKMRKRCPKCGTWRWVKYVCNLPGCKAKKIDVNMCKCTIEGLKR